MKKEIYKLRWGSTHDNVYYVRAYTPLKAWKILLKKQNSKLSAENMQYNRPGTIINIIEES